MIIATTFKTIHKSGSWTWSEKIIFPWNVSVSLPGRLRFPQAMGLVGEMGVGNIQRRRHTTSQGFRDRAGLDVDLEVGVPGAQRWGRETGPEEKAGADDSGPAWKSSGDGKAQKSLGIGVTQSMGIFNSSLATKWRNKEGKMEAVRPGGEIIARVQAREVTV